MMASILKIGISRNSNCNNMVDFPKSDHIYQSTILKQQFILKYIYLCYKLCHIRLWYGLYNIIWSVLEVTVLFILPTMPVHDKMIEYINYICDRACENQPCECKKIADFFHLCSI